MRSADGNWLAEYITYDGSHKQSLQHFQDRYIDMCLTAALELKQPKKRILQSIMDFVIGEKSLAAGRAARLHTGLHCLGMQRPRLKPFVGTHNLAQLSMTCMQACNKKALMIRLATYSCLQKPA